MIEDVKINLPVLPDFNAMRLKHRVDLAETTAQKEMHQALLDGYLRGMIEVQHDAWTGELLFSAAEIN
tara:strand:+ start:389 stop:592 length:204 start_codon:yes stop_codon:yes gene_type:complete